MSPLPLLRLRPCRGPPRRRSPHQGPRRPRRSPSRRHHPERAIRVSCGLDVLRPKERARRKERACHTCDARSLVSPRLAREPCWGASLSANLLTSARRASPLASAFIFDDDGDKEDGAAGGAGGGTGGSPAENVRPVSSSMAECLVAEGHLPLPSCGRLDNPVFRCSFTPIVSCSLLPPASLLSFLAFCQGEASAGVPGGGHHPQHAGDDEEEDDDFHVRFRSG